MGRGAIERRHARRAQDPEVKARAREHQLQRQAERGVELRKRAAERKAAGDHDAAQSLLAEARRAERGE